MLRLLYFYFLSILTIIYFQKYIYGHYAFSFDNLSPTVQVRIIFCVTACSYEHILECLCTLEHCARTSTQVRALVKAVARSQAKKLGARLFDYVKVHDTAYSIDTVNTLLRYVQQCSALSYSITKNFARAFNQSQHITDATLQDLNKALLGALTQSDKARAQFLLQAGASITICTQEIQQNIVHMLSCEHSDISFAKLLLKNSICIDARDICGNTVLILVARDRAKFNLVQLLLCYNADVNAQNNAGITALMAAVSVHDNIAIIRLLLDCGARVNTQTMHGSTALMFAAALGAGDTVRLLLAYGADMHSKAHDGTTALVQAKRENHQTIVALLQAIYKHEKRQHRQQRLCVTQ